MQVGVGCRPMFEDRWAAAALQVLSRRSFFALQFFLRCSFFALQFFFCVALISMVFCGKGWGGLMQVGVGGGGGG